MKVTVNTEILNWATQRSGKNHEALLTACPKLDSWLRQEEQPTLKQLEKFASATFTPIGKFFLDSPPEDRLPIADFRTLPNTDCERPSPHLLDTIYICQQRQAWYRQHCLAASYEQLDFVGSAKITDSPQRFAQVIRRSFSLNSPLEFPKLVASIEKQGLLVMCSGMVGSNTHRSLDLNEFRGFALSDDYAPLIFVNAKDANAGRSFTLVHELAHILLGESGVSNLSPKSKHNNVEQWCNQVAAEVLVPLEDFKNRFNMHDGYDDEKMSNLTKIYRVSSLVLLNRMKDANFIDENKFWQLYNMEEEKIQAILDKPNSNAGGGNFYHSKLTAISQRFGKALIISTLEGNTLYRDAMQMLGIKKTSTFERLAAQLNPWINNVSSG